MSRRLASALFMVSWLVLGLAWLSPSAAQPQSTATQPATRVTSIAAAREVVLAGRLADDELIALSADLAGGDQPAVLLLDTAKSSPAARNFLTAFGPKRVTPVGAFPEGIPDLEHRLDVKTGPALASGKDRFTRAHRVVVCPATPRNLLLQAACLAGVLRAPLWVLRGAPEESAALRQQLAHWHTRAVFAVGSAVPACRDLSEISTVELDREEAVAAAYLEHLRKKGPIRTLVVTNPADGRSGSASLSSLAPWVALRHRAALLCTNEAGDNTAAVVRAAVSQPELARADHVILVAGLKAIPTERRPNPAKGKDELIEMEPLTPANPEEPFSFAVGRLFHDDPGVLALVLARQELLVDRPGAPRPPRKALIVSNPGGGLDLLETFSRNTANELRNRGYVTTALFEEEVNRDDVRRLMPLQDIFLWEGHYRTMVDKYEMPKWNEPLRPALIFLQSCLALNEAEAQPLLQRGAIGVIGSATRTYSGSGGAFTLAFFDAVFYEDQSLGGALRHAKNFLLAYSQLKEKRLGDKAKLKGANLRSAWAFTLWGDPTLKLPQPEPPTDALAPIRHEVEGNTIIWTLPQTRYPKVVHAPYEASMRPNGRLAGLITKDEEDDKRLVPFLFGEVYLPRGKVGTTPRLTSRLPARHWVFSWDERRRCGYLLVVPRPRDEDEVRFHVSWDG